MAGLYVCVLIQRQLVDEFLDDSADISGVYAAQSGVHPQCLTDRHLVNERVELWTIADHTLTGTCCTPAHAHATQERVTGRDNSIAGQHGERCGFPGTVDTQQTETFTFRYTDRQAVDGQEIVVVELGQLASVVAS